MRKIREANYPFMTLIVSGGNTETYTKSEVMEFLDDEYEIIPEVYTMADNLPKWIYDAFLESESFRPCAVALGLATNVKGSRGFDEVYDFLNTSLEVNSLMVNVRSDRRDDNSVAIIDS